MSNLTGQQINQTYLGLLNLATATTGITSTLQQIQDGIGNNTGLRIATNKLEVNNIPSCVDLQPRYMGNGFNATAASNYTSGTQGKILATPFYDNGRYSYSALTLNVVSATSTSDTVEIAIYTSQIINPNGLFPHTPIISGLTADTTTIGLKTVAFPANISMSGYGGGVYWIVWKISNSGVQPTWRPGAGVNIINASTIGVQTYGAALGFTTNTYLGTPWRGNNGGNTLLYFSGQTTFDNPFSGTIDTTQSSSTSITGNNMGFLLNTVNG